MWYPSREYTWTALIFNLHQRMPNCSNKISFKTFADDANTFASAGDLTANVKKWCDVNKLSINMTKTNYMIVKSARKKDMTISLQSRNNDGSTQLLERKQCIKYLGVMIDENITWKNHISFVSSRISRNIGIISNLRHYFSLQQLKQIYNNLI